MKNATWRLILLSLTVFGLTGSSSAQTFLYGGPGSLQGRFQDANGDFDPQNWTGFRCSPDDSYWQISTFNAENLNGHGAGNHALWAGQTAEQQPSWTRAPGYGNFWNTAAEWRAEVPDPNNPTTVDLQFYYNFDTEPGFDFFMVDWHDGTTWQSLLSVDGNNKNAGVFDSPGELFSQNWVTQPSELVGPGQNEVRLRLFLRSDGINSDVGDYNFDGDGGAQVDDILVAFNGVPVDGGGDGDALATFEAGDDEGWTPIVPPCVCAIHAALSGEYDPSAGNLTPMLGRILDTPVGLSVSGSCTFRSPYFPWTTAPSLDGSFLEFDSFFWSTREQGVTAFSVEVTWWADGAWQPEETVFVGEQPIEEWQRIHVDLTNIAPANAEYAFMRFYAGPGDGLLDIVAIDNVTAGRFDTAVAAPSSPDARTLLRVHPNPANPRAIVEFQMESAGQVKLTVYDLRGRKVRSLLDRLVGPGDQKVPFDGRDDQGRIMASGSYIVRLETPQQMSARRVTIVK